MRLTFLPSTAPVSALTRVPGLDNWLLNCWNRRCGRTSSRVFVVACMLAVSVAAAFAQQGTLALSSGSTTPGGSVALELTLASAQGSAPAGLQWTLTYPPETAGVQMTAGPAATAAGKSLTCDAGSGTYTCILTGVNQTMIADGVVAVATVTASSSPGAWPIGVTNGLGASGDGNAFALNGSGGGVTVTGTALLTPVSVNCTPSTLAASGSTSCSVTLS